MLKCPAVMTGARAAANAVASEQYPPPEKKGANQVMSKPFATSALDPVTEARHPREKTKHNLDICMINTEGEVSKSSLREKIEKNFGLPTFIFCFRSKIL